MRIALGCDHAGFDLKERLKDALVERGLEIEDLGAHGPESTDYPDWGREVALRVASGAVQRGLLVCGSGIGMAIAANRIQGVRAAACNDLYSARLARAHNDANVLAVGSRVVAPALAEAILDVFLETPFDGGRHRRRVDKLDGIG